MAREHFYTRLRQCCAIALSVALCMLLVPPIREQAHAVDGLTQEQLAPHVVQGTNPDSTVVNLFDYTTGKIGAEGTSVAGTDLLSSTGGKSPYVNFTTWLTGAVVYLSSDACRYTQGQIIVVDGGVLLGLK